MNGGTATNAWPSSNTLPVGDVDLPFSVLLAHTCIAVAHALAEIPQGLLEARRFITRELQFEPSPELLQTIVQLAGDTDAEGPRREYPVRLLALHILARKELMALLEERRLDAERIRRGAERLPELGGAIRDTEGAIDAALETLALADRDYLQQVRGPLAIYRDAFLAAQVLAPRLELLATTVANASLTSAVPSLTRGEAALLESSAAGDDGPSRTVMNAIALRSVMQDDLSTWSEVLARTENDPDRREALDRLAADKTTFHFVSHHLQVQHDTALAAELDEFVETIRQVQRSLFSTYLNVNRVLTNPSMSEESAEDQLQSESVFEELREKRVEAEAVAEEHRAHVAHKEELIEKALSNIHLPAKEPTDARGSRAADELRRERLRIRILGSITGVLCVACIGAYAFLPASSPPPNAVSVEQFTETLRMNDVTPVGPLMHAEVPSRVWNQMNAEQKLHRVNETGEIAVEHGHAMVYMVDEHSRPLATWSKRGGAKLAER